MEKVVTKNTWFIAHNNDYSITHYGWVSTGKELDSGQPFVDEFYNVDDWLAKLTELGITPEPPLGPEPE
jgi:hypothetical protein